MTKLIRTISLSLAALLCFSLLATSLFLTTAHAVGTVNEPDERKLTFNVKEGVFYYEGYVKGKWTKYEAEDLENWDFDDGTLTLGAFKWITSTPTALEIVGGSLTLNLTGPVLLQSTYSDRGASNGIWVADYSSTLTITGQSTLQAFGGSSESSSAGIDTNSGKVIIRGGTITANGAGSGGVGINGDTQILGGTVTASGTGGAFRPLAKNAQFTTQYRPELPEHYTYTYNESSASPPSTDENNSVAYPVAIPNEENPDLALDKISPARFFKYLKIHPISSDARLANIKLAPYSAEDPNAAFPLTPAFSPNVFDYRLELPSTEQYLYITTTLSNQQAKLAGDWFTLTIQPGDNIFKLSVTAEDNEAMQTYTINVHRGADSMNLFTDVSSNDWFVYDVDWAYNGRYFRAINNTEFAPNELCTREMFFAALTRYTPQDPDVISKVSDSPDLGGNITRQDLITLLYRLASLKAAPEVQSSEFPDFEDFSQVGGYALYPLRWAVETGIITGKPGSAPGKFVFDPQGLTTRAEAIAMLRRYSKIDAAHTDY